jgi:hypothetical protein
MWIMCRPCTKATPGKGPKKIISRRPFAQRRWISHKKESPSHTHFDAKKDGQTALNASFAPKRKADEALLPPRNPTPVAPKMCEGILPWPKRKDNPIHNPLSSFNQYGVFPPNRKFVMKDFNGRLQGFASSCGVGATVMDRKEQRQCQACQVLRGQTQGSYKDLTRRLKNVHDTMRRHGHCITDRYKPQCKEYSRSDCGWREHWRDWKSCSRCWTTTYCRCIA